MSSSSVAIMVRLYTILSYIKHTKAGSDNLLAASQIAQQMQAQQMPVGPMAPGQDPSKMFKAEAENLAVIEHYSVLDGVEERLLERIKV